MEIVNIKRLKATLRQGDLPARETAKYLAAQGALWSLLFIPSPAPPLDWALVAYPLLSLCGVYYCYRQNGEESGRRFAERYLAIGWVVGWRAFFVLAPLFLLAVVFSFAWFGQLQWLEDPVSAGAITLGFLTLCGFLYWRIGRHLADLRSDAQVEVAE
jgi:hypothetical protein